MTLINRVDPAEVELRLVDVILSWVALQDDYDCLFCIVDDHAITAGGDPAEMPANVIDLATSFLAVGLDPERWERVKVQGTTDAG